MSDTMYLVDIADLDRVAGGNDAPTDLDAWCDRASAYLDEHSLPGCHCTVRPPRPGEIGGLYEQLPDGSLLPARAMLTAQALHEAGDLLEAAWRHAWETEA